MSPCPGSRWGWSAGGPEVLTELSTPVDNNSVLCVIDSRALDTPRNNCGSFGHNVPRLSTANLWTERKLCTTTHRISTSPGGVR